jgi:phage-related protein (TIGR01555 family)
MKWPWTKKQEMPKPDPVIVPRMGAQELEAVLAVLERRKATPRVELKQPVVFQKAKNGKGLAMDAAPALDPFAALGIMMDAGLTFPGYPALAELSMKAEYRNISGRIAGEMTRKWVRFSSASKGDKSQKIVVIEKRIKELGLRECFREAAYQEGLYGRSQIFVDMAIRGDELELKTALYLQPWKVGKGSLRGFRVIEPVWTYPYRYNALDPTRGDFYRPQSWFVMGKEIHDTRLLMFLSRPVSDLFKPSFNFGGLSLSQLCQPTVTAWFEAKSDVSKIIKNFRTQALKCNTGSLMQEGDAASLLIRAAIFTQVRDNQGLMVLQNGPPDTAEELVQLNTPLSELSKLQAQAQEHMAACAQIPLVVLTGITPSGLNASSEGEIRIYYDWIHDQQEAMFRKPLNQAVQLIQLSEFGEIDEDIVFNFVELFQLNGKDLARVRQQDAVSAQIYDAIQAVNGLEIRSKIASDPESGWDNLNASDPSFKPDAPKPGIGKKVNGSASAEAGAELGAEEGHDSARIAIDSGQFPNVDDPYQRVFR